MPHRRRHGRKAALQRREKDRMEEGALAPVLVTQMKYLLLILAILGVIVSSLALREHYREYGDSPCSINEHWDCGVVNHSRYAMLGPIPVAVVGILGYILMAGLAFFRSYRLSDRPYIRWPRVLPLPRQHRSPCPPGMVHLLRDLPRHRFPDVAPDPGSSSIRRNPPHHINVGTDALSVRRAKRA